MNRDWSEARVSNFDIVFVTCGYEARASYIYDDYHGQPGLVVVLDYKCAGVGSYDSNHALLSETENAVWVDLTTPEYGAMLSQILHDRLTPSDGHNEATALVDVSSCSRSVLATLLLALASLRDRCLVITCAYAVSEWFEPPSGELPSSVSEPVVGDLSGWSDDLSHPPCAIIGLGFEPGRALGSIDYLEVPEVRLFLPDGPDPRFRSAVEQANALLLDETGRHAIDYDVRDPSDINQKLTSLISGLLPHFRPIIIPLGPKIFATMSILVAIDLFPHVCVWRTSAGSGAEVADRKAAGEVVAFDYRFSATI